MIKRIHLFLLGLVMALWSCASQRKGAVCQEIQMRLNTMPYNSEQRGFIQEELDSCLSQQQNLQQQEQKQYQGIYGQFMADSLSRSSDSTLSSDSVEVSPDHP